jgi:2-keto-4-pentenoate hydratase/2-oxohepta-3-ene-1,7-dioic acid hydratase in catechol pathway
MTLMIVRYAAGNGQTEWGKLVGDAPSGPDQSLAVIQLSTGAATTGDLIAALDAGEIALEGPVKEIAAKDLRSPVTQDATLVCQGLNYSDHVAEAGHSERKANLLFLKASSSLSGPYEDIVRPEGVELLDYEVEVGVVLRASPSRGGASGEADLADLIAGFVLCNDVSARDVMFGASFLQWFQGKSYRTFCPAGPVLYLPARADLAAAADALDIRLFYNEELKQSANTRQLIYKPAETIKDISAIMDLKRGDMILTGTPGGVLAHVTPGVARALQDNLFNDSARRQSFSDELRLSSPFLQPGDVLTLKMSDARSGIDLGAQRTRIVAA